MLSSLLITVYILSQGFSYFIVLLPQLGSANLYSGITMPRQHNIPWWENRCWTGSSGAERSGLPWYIRWTGQHRLLWPQGGGPGHLLSVCLCVCVCRGPVSAAAVQQWNPTKMIGTQSCYREPGWAGKALKKNYKGFLEAINNFIRQKGDILLIVKEKKSH